MHSPKFNKIKMYYEKGVWSIAMVNNAVTKRWITEQEYQEITGEPYVPINEEENDNE